MYTDYEIDFIKENYGTMATKDIASILERPIHFVYAYASKFKIKKLIRAKRNNLWSIEEIENLIREIEKNLSFKEISRLHNRSYGSVRIMASRIGICQKPIIGGFCTTCHTLLSDTEKRGCKCHNCGNMISRYRNRLLKLKVVNHYGGRCICCGEDHIEFLTIDHINNDGNIIRSKMSQGMSMYRKVIKDKYPQDITILCMSCNLAKSSFGICPHSARQLINLPHPTDSITSCRYCGLSIPSKTHGLYRCKTCLSQINSIRRKIVRVNVLTKYGGECACCRENIWELLTINHVNNDGNKDRMNLKNASIYPYLNRLDLNPKYNVLCANCNCSIAWYGYCPHQTNIDFAQGALIRNLKDD